MLGINNVYNMDFRDGIGDIDGDIDLVATDPPYNIDFSYNRYDDDLADDEYIKLLAALRGYPVALVHYPEETMRYVVPALGVPDEVVAWCYNSNISRQFRLINFFGVDVDFNKVKQPYKNPNDKRIRKLIENGSEGTRMYDWFSDIQIVKNVSREKNIHPCPVPVKLMERIILLATDEGDLVVDPFGGCGTTAIACLNTKRNYVCFEIDETYCEEAERRIHAHRKELGL